MIDTNFVVINHQDIDQFLFIEFIFIHAHDDISARINFGLLFSGSRFNFELGPTAFNGFGHAAHGVYFQHNFPCFIGHLLREVFHHVGAGPGINHASDVGFFLEN